MTTAPTPATMEQVHGIDVSWMTPGSSKDKLNKSSAAPSAPASQPRQIPTPANNANGSHRRKDSKSGTQTNGQSSVSPNGGGSSLTKRLSRSGSVDRHGPNGTPPGRRSTWFSNISAKFSSSSPAANGPQSPTEPTSPGSNNGALPHRGAPQEEQQQPPPPQPPASPQAVDPPVPKISPSRNAVLQPGAKPEGSGPYTPAPPRSGQAGILSVFRRLSSSSGAGGSSQGRQAHGLVERKVLNKDHNRERCPINELKAAKLRRVAFCVDVEIAPMPKYSDGEVATQPIDKTTKKKLTEQGEGQALKNAAAAQDGPSAAVDESKPAPAAPAPDATTNGHAGVPSEDKLSGGNDSGDADAPVAEKEMSRKKEKKKRSEEERKARKEKRRRLAEDNGTIPLEIHYDSGDSSDSASPGPKTTAVPTTNPVRIYRRCCQLRETPILKKITEQLIDPANVTLGVVSRLDLTGYWLQLADLVTLGDYLAVVPVREVVLENIGLTDEGLRVILAGLLSAKQPDLRRKKPKHELEPQGGVIERLILKNNKLGPDGWKHLSLFIYLCRSLKHLDLSHIPFPRQAVSHVSATLPNGQQIPRSIADVFSTSLANRLGGPTLEMINIGETEPSMDQLGVILDGVMKCGVRRLGIAHNYLDAQGVDHVIRYVSSGLCEGLDLGGNDLSGHVEKLSAALEQNGRIWAISLAGCELNPSSFQKILPALASMEAVKFVDFSHNKDLFQSRPSAVGLLRRYLPKLDSLKRIHLSDVNMNSEQAIALVEILPEVRHLAHISLLENEELAKLAHAKSEEAQEEACALYASLMAAARVSKSIIAIDIDVPHDEAGEIVKALAKQVVAYCLRNLEQMPDTDIGAAVAASLSESNGEGDGSKAAGYSDVIMHLVGHDVLRESDDEDDVSAPGEDYVIGGTGVVKALECCLENRGGDESRRQSGEFIREVESDESLPDRKLPTGRKAKDMSKHLLAGARKIRLRLQPALIKARATPGDEMNLRKLMFLDDTLQGIIKRFEDEYPDTREAAGSQTPEVKRARSISLESTNSVRAAEDPAAVLSDAEEGEIHGPRLPRTNSTLSRVLTEEEGRLHRAGHRFRASVASHMQRDDDDEEPPTQQQQQSQSQPMPPTETLECADDAGEDPRHMRMLEELAEELGGEFWAEVQAKGVKAAYRENREALMRTMRDSDPDGGHWERFIESQNKALANRRVPNERGLVRDVRDEARDEARDESAIADE